MHNHSVKPEEVTVQKLRNASVLRNSSEVQFYVTSIYHNDKYIFLGLKGWLSCEEHLLLLQRTGV